MALVHWGVNVPKAGPSSLVRLYVGVTWFDGPLSALFEPPWRVWHLWPS